MINNEVLCVEYLERTFVFSYMHSNFKQIRRLLAESDFQANNFEKHFDKKLYLLKSCSGKVLIYYKSHKKKQRTQFQSPKNQINFDIVR